MSNDDVLRDFPELRAHWEDLGKARFVPPDEYCELLVSRRQLTRWDVRKAGLRGLIDSTTGEYFLTYGN
ncbi:MAG: hypothetical protein MI757_17130 [Pirellulales bacterium]|nr:hypothetical protein [Pirellulales bacterium]